MISRTKITVPLTRDEQLLTKQYLVRGELGLTERGFTTDEVQEFLARPEIQTYLRHVYDDYVEKDARRDRVNYFALTELERWVTPAISIIARALTGVSMPKSIDDPNPQGSSPTEQQYNAAVQLLDRLGIKVSNKNISDTKVNPVTALNNIQINVSDAVIKDTVSIEKVLGFVDAVMNTAKKAAQTQMDLDGNRKVIEMKRLPDKSQTESAHTRLNELNETISKTKVINGKKKKKERAGKSAGVSEN